MGKIIVLEELLPKLDKEFNRLCDTNDELMIKKAMKKANIWNRIRKIIEYQGGEWVCLDGGEDRAKKKNTTKKMQN